MGLGEMGCVWLCLVVLRSVANSRGWIRLMEEMG
jgi:hypothetical protein